MLCRYQIIVSTAQYAIYLPVSQLAPIRIYYKKFYIGIKINYIESLLHTALYSSFKEIINVSMYVHHNSTSNTILLDR